MMGGEQPPWIVPDGLWDRIEPSLPKVERRVRHPGRKRLDDRKVLCGILFVLYTAIRGSSCRRSWGSAPG
jgi:transposase